MTVSLGGIELSSHLTLDIQGAGVAYSQRRCIGGAAVVQADGNDGGRTMTMNSAGHMTIVQLEQIRTLQALGLPVDLIHHRGNFSVLIIDTAEMSDDFDIANPDADATLTVSGNITMIEV